jgi:hypothetical protein
MKMIQKYIDQLAEDLQKAAGRDGNHDPSAGSIKLAAFI